MRNFSASRFIAFICLAALIQACSSVPKVGSLGNELVSKAPQNEINWPPQYQLKDATFKVQNAIEINASAEVVWKLLIDAERWPDWYVGAGNVRIVSGTKSPSADAAPSVLSADSVFTWNTMGLSFSSTVTEFLPPYRLSWESRKSTIQGYHAWMITPTANGVRVVTEESQHGFLATLQGIFQPNKLRKLHDVWLAEMKKLAEAKNGAIQ